MMVAKPQVLGPGECDTKTAARLAMCSDVWIGKLVKEGWIPKLGPNRFRVIDVVHGRIKHMQDEARRSTQSKSASRVQDVRATQIEVQTKKELGELIQVEDVIAWISETLGMLRTELTGLPAACSRDPEVRAEIEKQLDGRIAKFRSACEAASSALERRRPILLDPEEADA